MEPRDDSSAVPSKRQGIGPLAAKIARAYARAVAEAVAPLDLAPAQLAVLRLLWKRDGLTQSELARRLDVEQATMAKTLQRMSRDGLVLCAPHARDRRALSIRPTEKAIGLKKEARAAAKRVNAIAVAGLSRKERKRFAELGARVIAALTSHENAPPPRGSVPAAAAPKDAVAHS